MDEAKRRRLEAAGFRVGSASEFGVLLTAETEKWGKVVKFASIKPE